MVNQIGPVTFDFSLISLFWFFFFFFRTTPFGIYSKDGDDEDATLGVKGKVGSP